MKKTISMLTAICIACGLLASCGRAEMPAQTTTEDERTTAAETTAYVTEPMTEEETTEEVTTEETTRPRIKEELSGFYQRLCSDTWIEVCADPNHAMRVQFLQDGGVQIDSQYACEGEWCSDRSVFGGEDRSDWDNEIGYSKDSMCGHYFIDDVNSDDLMHLDVEGCISDHRIMIRESRFDHKADFAERLKNTSWHSAWFADEKIDTVRIADFTVYPVNETTAYMEYSSKVGSDRVRVIAVQTKDENTLDAYLITTYAEEGYCPEPALITEQWTVAS